MDPERVLERLAPLGEVRAKRMFGGHGLYLDELFFGLISGDGRLYLKTDNGNRAVFEALGSEPFRPFPDRPASMSYHEVPPAQLERPAELVELARGALEAARRKPAKRRPRGGAQPIGALKNLGPASAAWLREVGVRTRADLESLGSIAAFRAVEARGHGPSLNLLYALEAALLDVRWTELPEPLRAELRRGVGRERPAPRKRPPRRG